VLHHSVLAGFDICEGEGKYQKEVLNAKDRRKYQNSLKLIPVLHTQVTDSQHLPPDIVYA